MSDHIVRIWRNDETKQWFHRFHEAHGKKELARQSQGVSKSSHAVKSAQKAYGLGELTVNVDIPAYTKYVSTARPDVIVMLWKARRRHLDERTRGES